MECPGRAQLDDPRAGGVLGRGRVFGPGPAGRRKNSARRRGSPGPPTAGWRGVVGDRHLAAPGQRGPRRWRQQRLIKATTGECRRRRPARPAVGVWQPSVLIRRVSAADAWFSRQPSPMTSGCGPRMLRSRSGPSRTTSTAIRAQQSALPTPASKRRRLSRCTKRLYTGSSNHPSPRRHRLSQGITTRRENRR